MAKNHIGEAIVISSNNKLKSILPKFDGLRLDAQMPQPAARSRRQPGDLRCECPLCVEAWFQLAKTASRESPNPSCGLE
jgi:hypothetical protein